MFQSAFKSVSQFISCIKNPKAHQFALKRVTMYEEDGKVTYRYYPLTRQGLGNWDIIVHIYDRFIPLQYEKPGGLTETSAKNHIRAYKEQLVNDLKGSIKCEEIISMDDERGLDIANYNNVELQYV